MHSPEFRYLTKRPGLRKSAFQPNMRLDTASSAEERRSAMDRHMPILVQYVKYPMVNPDANMGWDQRCVSSSDAERR